MKKAIFVCMIFGISAIVLGFSKNAKAGEFIVGFEDIPLMPSLKELSDGVTAFDAPQARFIQVVIRNQAALPFSKILAFYDENLESLGWKKQSEDKQNCYLREDEQLCILNNKPANSMLSFELQTIAK